MIEISSKPCRSLEGSPTTWLGTLKVRFKEVVPWVEDPVKALFFPLVFEVRQSSACSIAHNETDQSCCILPETPSNET